MVGQRDREETSGASSTRSSAGARGWRRASAGTGTGTAPDAAIGTGTAPDAAIGTGTVPGAATGERTAATIGAGSRFQNALRAGALPLVTSGTPDSDIERRVGRAVDHSAWISARLLARCLQPLDRDDLRERGGRRTARFDRASAGRSSRPIVRVVADRPIVGDRADLAVLRRAAAPGRAATSSTSSARVHDSATVPI